MTETVSQNLLTALARIPDWIRRDFSSKDNVTRERAEEALAAIIISALDERQAD